MVAQVIDLGRVARRKRVEPAPLPQRIASPEEVARHEFEFWTGASGRPYVHTVYSLLWCPEIPDAIYLLVRRDASGQRQVLSVAAAEHEAPSLNLAEIRQQGARLGANEVHVHFLAGSARRREATLADLDAALSPDRARQLQA